MTLSVSPRYYYECPECGDTDTGDGRTLYCGICAGDCGRDVRMNKREMPPENLEDAVAPAPIVSTDYLSLQDGLRGLAEQHKQLARSETAALLEQAADAIGTLVDQVDDLEGALDALRATITQGQI